MVFVEVWEVQESTCLKKPLKMELLAPPGGLIALIFGAQFFFRTGKEGWFPGWFFSTAHCDPPSLPLAAVEKCRSSHALA